MDEIRITIPNVKLADIVKRKAKTTISRYLTKQDLSNKAWQVQDNWYTLQGNIEEVSYDLTDSDALLFYSELLIHLNNVYDSELENSKPLDVKNEGDLKNLLSIDETILHNIQDLQYYFHKQITELGFNIDPNNFTTDEATDISSKVDKIISQLEILQAGHDILYERIEELKDDFKDVQATVPLGKKLTLQRILGVTLGYLGEKGADEAYDAIIPIVKDIVKNVPELLT